MDFGALPPEVNSVRMYAGPGSAPMVAAASAWNGLAAELSSAATGYETVITQLSSEGWLGPASAAMAEAVAPYVAWMSAAAAQAEQAATQARAAAAAFEAAFAATVPPPLIAANRASLMQLISTNVFGQNTSAIAAAEAQYGEMWAQTPRRCMPTRAVRRAPRRSRRLARRRRLPTRPLRVRRPRPWPPPPVPPSRR